MKPRHTIAALVAAIAIAIYFLLTPAQPPDAPAPVASTDAGKQTTSPVPPPGVPASTAAGKSSAGASNKKPGIDWERFARMLETGPSTAPGDSWPRPTAADIDRFIAKRGESAANLVAAFECGHDRRWITRALELFPNDPRVLLAAIGSSDPGAAADSPEGRRAAAARKELIGRFKAAAPDNPLPWLFAAQDLFKAKQTGEAIAEIRDALQRPGFYIYGSERIAAARQIYEDIGLQPLEAEIIAAFGLALPHMSAANQSSRGLMALQKSAVESGDTAAAEDAIKLTYSLGRMFATPEASRTLIGQLVGTSMERRALEALPPDARRDYLPVTPQQRIAEMDRQKQLLRDLTPLTDALLRSKDEPTIAEYFRRNSTDGELSALTWLKAQQKK